MGSYLALAASLVVCFFVEMRTPQIFGAAIALLAFSQLAAALYTPGKTKVDLSLTKDNFASSVLDSDSVYGRTARFFRIFDLLPLPVSLCIVG